MREEPETSGSEPIDEQEKARRQRDLLLAFVAKMEALPDDTPRDGFSNRDHDRLIYSSGVITAQ